MRDIEGIHAMQIDPRIATGFNVIAAILMVTVASSADLTEIFGDEATQIVIHVCAYFGALIAAINAVLHGAAPPAGRPATSPPTERS
jgi:nucleoside recognition membrane protein YjiH